jgi:hypothetical protein
MDTVTELKRTKVIYTNEYNEVSLKLQRNRYKPILDYLPAISLGLFLSRYLA